MTTVDQTTMATAPETPAAEQPIAASAVSAPLTPAAPAVAKTPAKPAVKIPAKKAAQPVKATTPQAIKPVVKAVAKKAPLAAAKPVAKTVATKTAATKPAATKAVTKAAVKSAPSVAARVATKTPAKATPKAVVALATTPKFEKLLKAKKPKLVRDSFTIPKLEYLILEELKQRSGKLGNSVKKSELIRAGIKVLATLSDASLLAALKAVPAIKTGRPAKD